MRRKLVLVALTALLMTGCVSRVEEEYIDPPCGVKETEAGLCKEPTY